MHPDARALDASGKIVAPGLIDMYAELRELGFEEDETTDTGTLAALAGWYTALCAIPNTDPPIDSQAGVQFVRKKAARANRCRVHVVACVRKGRKRKSCRR